MYVGPGPEWDTERWQRAVAAAVTSTLRVEVWSAGEMLTESAPGVLGGSVTEDWVTTGISRSLSMTVEPSRQWFRWFEAPSLEIRPWLGIRFSRSLSMECPMGVFPMESPDRALPSTAVQLSASDYMAWVADADFVDKPVPRPAGPLTDAIRWLVRGAGLPDPVNRSSAQGSSPETVLDRTRLDALDDASKAAGVEVIADRSGDVLIRDAQTLGAPASSILTGTGGTCAGVQYEPDWGKVHNVVAVSSSAQGIDLTVSESVAWTGHPAHPYRLGSPQRPRYKVLRYSSPLITDEIIARQTALTMLRKESAVAETYTYKAFPDPTRDAGDSILGATPDGEPRAMQVTRVVHPLRRDEGQMSQVTAASTLVSL